MDTVGIARTMVRSTGALSPALGARIALRMFFQTRPRIGVRDDERATHQQSERDIIRVRSERVTTYRWGRGAETVLVVHGWRGRSSQFAPLISELADAGYQVVAFDAPGHGDSTGKRTDIRDWLDAIEQLHARHGHFRMIVGHSFGALAGVTAVRAGITADAVASIAGAGNTAAFIDQFADTMMLPPRTKRRFERAFYARLDEDAASARRRYDALLHPLPPHVELLAVHDADDRRFAIDWSDQLVAAHADRARLIRTMGFGHNRILSAEVLVESIITLATDGLEGIDTVLQHRRMPGHESAGTRP